jgi:hypothetical protein
MTGRSTADVEALLRRTYADVAARTEVDGRIADVPVRQIDAARRSRPTWTLAAAAALVVVTTGALFVVARGDERAATDDRDLIHAIPTYVPRPDAGVNGLDHLPVTALSSSDEQDRIDYASESLSISVVVDRAAIPELDGRAVTVRNAQIAQIAGDDTAGALRWQVRPDLTVTIEWDGSVQDGTEAIAGMIDGLVLVDTATWERVVDHAGFAAPGEQLVRRRIDGLDVVLEGSIQSDLEFRVGNIGWTAPRHAQCRAINNGDNMTWIVVSPFTVGTVQAVFDDGVELAAELEQLSPGSDFGIAVVRRERARQPTEPSVTCEETGS